MVHHNHDLLTLSKLCRSYFAVAATQQIGNVNICGGTSKLPRLPGGPPLQGG